MSEKKHAPRRREFLSTSAKTLAGATAASIFASEALASSPPVLPNAEQVVAACQQAFAARDFASASLLTSPNLVEHAPLLVVRAHEFINDTSTGENPSVEDIKNFLSVFPDAEVKIEDIFSSGDKAVYRWTGSGTHQGEFLGIAPTGKRVTIEGITIARIENGQVVETWRQFEFMGALEALGLTDKALDLMKELQ
jgi:predicted ester cyclase